MMMFPCLCVSENSTMYSSDPMKWCTKVFLVSSALSLPPSLHLLDFPLLIKIELFFLFLFSTFHLILNKNQQKQKKITTLVNRKEIKERGGGEIDELETMPMCQVITTNNRKKSTEMSQIIVRNLSNLRDATCQTSDTETKYLQDIRTTRERQQQQQHYQQLRNSMERDVSDDFRHQQRRRDHPGLCSYNEFNSRSGFMVGSGRFVRRIQGSQPSLQPSFHVFLL